MSFEKIINPTCSVPSFQSFTETEDRGQTHKQLQVRQPGQHPDSGDKIELRGLLKPADANVQVDPQRANKHRYTLETAFEDLPLTMGFVTKKIAGLLVWEDVIVLGRFDDGDNIFHVERIRRFEHDEPVAIGLTDFMADFSDYYQRIKKLGKLEPAVDIAS